MSDEFPEFSNDELIHWLQAKYKRHGEIEDGVAAERLKSISAALGQYRSVLEKILKTASNNGEDCSLLIAKEALSTEHGQQQSVDDVGTMRNLPSGVHRCIHGYQSDQICPYCDDDASLSADVEQLKRLSVWLYNQGYTQGHHDTVEACYTDLHHSDMDTYHDDVVTDLMAERQQIAGVS